MPGSKQDMKHETWEAEPSWPGRMWQWLWVQLLRHLLPLPEHISQHSSNSSLLNQEAVPAVSLSS